MTLQDYQTITTRVLGHFKVHPDSLKIKIKDVYGGRTNLRYMCEKLLFNITLPKWLEEYDKWYAIYYIIHEVCHVIDLMKGGGWEYHSEVFKRIEDEALALWGIRIVRAKAYPKELYANGQRVNDIVRKDDTYSK